MYDLTKLKKSDFFDIKKNLINAVTLARNVSFTLCNNDDYECGADAERIALCCLRALGGLANAEEFYDLDSYKAEVIELKRFIESIVDSCRIRARKTSVTFLCECPLDCYVSVDPQRLCNCLLNLIVNSFSKVDLDEGLISIKVSRINDSVSLSVSDNGYGMERAELDRILADDSHTGGLAAVKKFCSKAGTHLITECGSGGGGFMASFRLPLAEKPEEGFASAGIFRDEGTFSPVNIYFSKVETSNLMF